MEKFNPQRVEDFTLGTTLGTGTFGRVRLVTPVNGDTSTPLALKMLKKTIILELQQLDHIKSEKRLLEQIEHPFIIKLHGTFQDERCVYMVLEYICGGELFTRLRREGRFANDVSLFYATEIITAFEYLHSIHIAYRDLKPENILIDVEGHIKITDFGFAKTVEDRTYTLCGTPEYLAPEIIQSKGHNKSVDWWALGVLIFEMIAGYPPFYDETPFGIYQKIMAGVVDYPRVFHPNAKDLISKLLTADRTKRYGCMKAGAEDVKKHKWFKGVDWEIVKSRGIPPPWIPNVKHPEDTHLFEEYPDSDEDFEGPSTEENKCFDDF
mmetsp:Transcript_60290/g.68704  ORF Transcript_60290/g.68704 Transcript_60290/m.68704 type:complete len:323 (+) Transcript_60290:318-1286(+)|eukprot:CAMPEP_0115000894 /NCGR_PEP_ID=MMETSP0216-20121206/17038_1 /TAXON_ID=223996 /ORGANISM="Protocruzia adherens, Strain Boccale" /LENGTH=322 /DNA_ID=CAMNT_0002366097 /DNA_START=206 /DNA_END=1174 /DNA_ORIENTATION=-